MDVPRTLREQLAARKVIPFVGAGISMAVRSRGSDARLFPSWKELLLHAAVWLEHDSKSREAAFVRAGLDLDDPDFLHIAAQAKKYLGPVWARFLKEELNHDRNTVQDESLALPKLLWQLGSRLIITTNYDKVLRWSCQNSGDCETWNIENKTELAHFLASQDAEKPTVWHLHGSIEDASRIILTRDGYNLLTQTMLRNCCIRRHFRPFVPSSPPTRYCLSGAASTTSRSACSCKGSPVFSIIV